MCKTMGFVEFCSGLYKIPGLLFGRIFRGDTIWEYQLNLLLRNMQFITWHNCLRSLSVLVHRMCDFEVHGK